MKMKLLTASLSSLLVTAEAFGPINLIKSKRVGRQVSSTILNQSETFDDTRWGAGSYLGSLSNSSPRTFVSTTPTAASSSYPAPSSSSTIITKLNLDLADALSNSVIAAVKRNNFPPIVVSILDKQANTLVQKRMDGDVHAAFPEFSYAKAYTCVTMNVSSREFRDKYTKDNDPEKIAQVNSMMAITGKMAAFPGGVLLRNEEGEVVGAIGVSGAAGDEDEYAALRGVWDLGLPLRTQPVDHSCTTALE